MQLDDEPAEGFEGCCRERREEVRYVTDG